MSKQTLTLRDDRHRIIGYVEIDDEGNGGPEHGRVQGRPPGDRLNNSVEPNDERHDADQGRENDAHAAVHHVGSGTGHMFPFLECDGADCAALLLGGEPEASGGSVGFQRGIDAPVGPSHNQEHHGEQQGAHAGQKQNGGETEPCHSIGKPSGGQIGLRRAAGQLGDLHRMRIRQGQIIDVFKGGGVIVVHHRSYLPLGIAADLAHLVVEDVDVLL